MRKVQKMFSQLMRILTTETETVEMMDYHFGHGCQIFPRVIENRFQLGVEEWTEVAW